MAMATAKEHVDELTVSLAKIGKTMQSASAILDKENPDYEELFALGKALAYSQGQFFRVSRDFGAMLEAVQQLAHHQKCVQYNLIPYAKSITYRAIHRENEWEMQYDGDACHVVSEATPLSDGYGFSVKMASDTSDMASTRTVALSNLVIEMAPEDEKWLNDFGLVSKRQLKKMDCIISLVEGLGKKQPKTPEEVFAKAFVKPFQTIYMENPLDIRQGKLQKGAMLACHALHERFADNFSAEQYAKLSQLAQKLSPVPLSCMWQEQNLAR